MKAAFITDIHGHYVALRAALEAIAAEGVDSIYCLGDLVVPYPFPYEVLALLKSYKATVIKGNGEDKLLSCFNKGSIKDIHQRVNFLPTLQIAAELDDAYRRFLFDLPLVLRCTLGGEQALLCHGTPFDCADFLFYMDGETNRKAFDKISEKIIICGHNHWAKQLKYGDRTITYAGSVGVPFLGAHVASYLIVDDSSGVLECSWRHAPYDAGELIAALLKVGFLQRGGPISWLMFDEALTQQNRLSPFFANQANRQIPNTVEAWSRSCREYLESIGRWNEVVAYL